MYIALAQPSDAWMDNLIAALFHNCFAISTAPVLIIIHL